MRQALKRQKMAGFYRDMAFLRAMMDDNAGASEMYQDYMNVMMPELELARESREQEMATDLDRYKTWKMEIAEDPKTGILKLRMN